MGFGEVGKARLPVPLAQIQQGRKCSGRASARLPRVCALCFSGCSLTLTPYWVCTGLTLGP